MPNDSGAPRIAVLIPCYCDGPLLADALGSLQAQEPCEVVVVDDGSPDEETQEVLKELEEAGTCVLHQPNLGPSAARNAALAATTARYVFPLDADDMVFPHALTRLADLLDEDPTLSFAWGTAICFGARAPGRPVGLRVDQLDPWRISYLNEIPGGSLIRRTALESVGGWRDGTGYEDWDLWMALAERGERGRGIGVPVQRYRIHASRRWTEVSQRHAQVCAELRAAHPALYAQRLANWRRSPASLRLKLSLPVLEALRLSPRYRLRLGHALLHPRKVLQDQVRARLVSPRLHRSGA